MLAHWVKLATPSFQDASASVMLELRLATGQRATISDDQPLGVLPDLHVAPLSLRRFLQIDEVEIAVVVHDMPERRFRRRLARAVEKRTITLNAD